jgi:hypothetical protein
LKNFYRIASGVDVTAVMIKLAHNPQLWHADTYLRDYPQGPFGEVDSIICRFPPRSVKETQAEAEAFMTAPGYDQHECKDLPMYDKLPEVRRLVMQMFQAVGGVRLGRVFINRMQPGGRIFKHADTPAHADYWHRHHLVLQSAPGVVFSAGDEQVYMAPGEFWYFNNGKAPDRPEHEVFNGSAVQRLHLVMDAKV